MNENKPDPNAPDACDRAFTTLEYPIDGRETGPGWYFRQAWTQATVLAATEIASLKRELALAQSPGLNGELARAEAALEATGEIKKLP